MSSETPWSESFRVGPGPADPNKQTVPSPPRMGLPSLPGSTSTRPPTPQPLGLFARPVDTPPVRAVAPPAGTSPARAVAPPVRVVAPPVRAVAPPSGPSTVRAVSPPVRPGQHQPSNAPVAPPSASHAGVVRVDADDKSTPDVRLDSLLMHLMEVGGSDLHLAAGSAPRVRIRGDMGTMANTDVLTPTTIQTAIYGILSAKQQKKFEENFELDFAYNIEGEGRFRANIFRQRGSIGAVFRTIPWEIKSLESLNMPEVLSTFSGLPRGLVLITGPTGSGKSTTLAAIIDQANRTRSGHIMTIEDPIEFLHEHRRSIVNQREVGDDTVSFAEALKRVLRQDPDIILVGELRDLETIGVALTAAETGHLVFATLHTQSAPETITRLVDVFPPEQQAQIATQLAASLQAVVCQTLCKTADGMGRVAAVEIMICDTGIRAMIRDGKLQQIGSALETGSRNGSQTLNGHLSKLVLSGQVTYKEAVGKCSNVDDLLTLLHGKTGPDKQANDGSAFAPKWSPPQETRASRNR